MIELILVCYLVRRILLMCRDMGKKGIREIFLFFSIWLLCELLAMLIALRFTYDEATAMLAGAAGGAAGGYLTFLDIKRSYIEFKRGNH